MADEMIDEMTDLGRLPDIHLVMDFALLSTALMTDPRMTGVPRVSAVPEITALARIFHPFLLRRPKSFHGCVMFRSTILNVYKTRLRSRTSHALPRNDLSHLATKRMKYPG
jgi:hypothetical protein